MDVDKRGTRSTTHVRSLTVLDFGRGDFDMGYVIAPGDLDGVWRECHFPGFLVELADGRRVLIDTGPHRRHIEEPMFEFAGSDFANYLRPTMTSEDDPLHRLAEIGLTADDIDILVVTHCHFDHCGNVADFSSSEIVIHGDAFEDGRTRGDDGRPGGIPLEDSNGNRLNYRVIDGDVEIAPGLTLLETPGHAPGHLSILIDLPDAGKILLAIDAIYTETNLEQANYIVAGDSEQAKRSAERLVTIAEVQNATFIFGHDPDQWADLRKAPERYT